MKKDRTNKKLKSLGFTLIELLATLFILLIIVVISTPNIEKMFNKSEVMKKASTEERLIDAAKQYTTIYNRSVLNGLVSVGDKTQITADSLVKLGLIEQSEIDILEEDTVFIVATLNSSSQIEYTVEYNQALIENQKPYITLLGNPIYYLKIGTTFTDPGWIALDAAGNNLTSSVVRSGHTFNTSVIGEYTITYSVVDGTGLAATPVTRKVIILDATVPSVSVATIISNNSLNNKLVKNGETLTLSMTFTKSVTDPTVTIGGRSATVTGSGTTRTATYTILPGETALNQGNISISISNYFDLYSNAGAESTTITSGGTVVYDRLLPTVTVATIVSNNALNNKQAKNDDTVTLSMTFSESISNTPTVTIGTRTATLSGSGTTRTATYLIPAAEATITQGVLPINIYGYTDATGNVGYASTTVTSGGTVNYDRTIPVYTSFFIGGSGNPSYVTTQSTTLYSTVSGATQMCISTTTSCSAWETYAASKAYTLTAGYSSKTLYIWYRDAAGNMTSMQQDVVNYMEGPHVTTYTCSASGYSYTAIAYWSVTTSTVIQGSATNSNYYGLMYFNDLAAIKTKNATYSASSITITIKGNQSYSEKILWLYVGSSCPTLNYTNQTTYTIADGKPTMLSAYMSTAATGTENAVFTITDTTWINHLMSASSGCIFINKGTASSSYWEGAGSKTATPPTMQISWTPR